MLTAMTEPDSNAIGEHIRQLTTAYEQTREAIEHLPAGRPAFDTASELLERLGKLYEDAARLRAEQAERIQSDPVQALSLAELAEHIGVTRQRAHQILQQLRPKEPGDG